MLSLTDEEAGYSRGDAVGSVDNEPVAWMCPTGLEYKQRATDFMYNDALYDTKLNWIPLYTHPHSDKSVKAKTLTDEEIHDLIVNKVTDYDMIKQALRKAQGD
jgi:hypothetical protein